MITEIKSRFSVKFLLTLTALILLPVVFSVSILFALDKKEAISLVALFLMIPMSVAFFAFYYTLKHVYIITFTRDKINLRFLLKEIELTWDDILEIRLTGKHEINLGMFIGVPYDAAEFITQKHKSYFLSYQHYSNHITLLKLLEQVSILKNNSQVEQTIQLGHYEGKRPIVKPFKIANGKKYSGTVFRSLSFYQNFIFTLLGIGVLSYMNPFALSLGVGIILFCYLNSGKKFNHFIISDTHLIIRNYFFFLRKRGYELSEIREVVIEEPEKSPIHLKVITGDFEYWTHIGAGLNNETWKDLLKDLSEKHIKIRREIHL